MFLRGAAGLGHEVVTSASLTAVGQKLDLEIEGVAAAAGVRRRLSFQCCHGVHVPLALPSNSESYCPLSNLPKSHGWALSVNVLIRRAWLVVSRHGVVTDGEEQEPCP